MEKYFYITLFLPLVSSCFASIFGGFDKKIFVGIISSFLLVLSTISSFILLFHNNGFDINIATWISAGSVHIPYGFKIDKISSAMMATVCFISALIHIYSIGYMKNDSGFNRYFAYLSGFVFSMLFLVSSDNFGGLFIGWEGVGVCSWLLIGFWYKKDIATWSANEAFIMNRIADLPMLLGVILIFWTFNSLNYDVVLQNISYVNPVVLSTIALLLFIGAMGKSAQFPFHTWLADAMEGPTPVSALIHAATMVTAGVYLIIRVYEIFYFSPSVSFFITALGTFVAVFAGTMALVNTDLKRIIAYSTLSQLGYMFVAAGLGLYWLALFHLIIHAFAKALLFLGSGNVMHAMSDELNIEKMGGLFKKMQWTAIFMIIGSFSISAVYPFAGFFSKDPIIEGAFINHSYIIWIFLVIGSAITAFYSFRLIMVVFFGKSRYRKFAFRPKEAYAFMLIAMLPLALLSIGAGFFKSYFVEFISFNLPYMNMHIGDKTLALMLPVLTLLIVISSVLVAILVYLKGNFNPSSKKNVLYKILKNQYYIPQFYSKFISHPYFKISLVLWQKVELRVIDMTVDFVAKIIYISGDDSRKMQDGDISTMIRLIMIGLVVILLLIVAYSILI